MGNISLSHCKDAITMIWHKSKIGIYIERTDRDLNNIKFAEKYFFYTNKSNHNKDVIKNLILNQWLPVEAAIKLNHGKLTTDINHCQFFDKPKELFIRRKPYIEIIHRLTSTIGLSL